MVQSSNTDSTTIVKQKVPALDFDEREFDLVGSCIIIIVLRPAAAGSGPVRGSHPVTGWVRIQSTGGAK
eukprot:COSAG02_NODE_12711_length_1505_cov_1.527027_1_plen_68_part_10